MRKLTLLLLTAGVLYGLEPQAAIRFTQPIDGDVQLVYRFLPEASIGLRFQRSDIIALSAGVSGSMKRGVGTFSLYELWYAKARLALDVRLSQQLGARVSPGLIFGLAYESVPVLQNSGQQIITYTVGGTGLGLSMDASMPLVRFGRARLDAECGVDLFRVLTDRVVKPYGTEQGEYYVLRLQNYGLGLALRGDPSR